MTHGSANTVGTGITSLNDQNVFAFAELEQPGLQMDYNLIFAPDGSDEVEYDWNG